MRAVGVDPRRGEVLGFMLEGSGSLLWKQKVQKIVVSVEKRVKAKVKAVEVVLEGEALGEVKERDALQLKDLTVLMKPYISSRPGKLG